MVHGVEKSQTRVNQLSRAACADGNDSVERKTGDVGELQEWCSWVPEKGTPIGLRWERSVGKAAGGTEEWVGADADSWESVQVTSSLLTVVELSLSSRQHHPRACVGGEVGEAGTLRMTEKLWYSLLGEWIDRKCCMIAVPVVVGSLRACWKSVGWNWKWDQPALCFPPALELG